MFVITPETEPFCMRFDDGIQVMLFWNQTPLEDDDFIVRVLDIRTGEKFEVFPANGREAMHAFHHPNAARNHAYAA